MRDYIAEYLGVMQGDSRTLDYRSYTYMVYTWSLITVCKWGVLWAQVYTKYPGTRRISEEGLIHKVR